MDPIGINGSFMHNMVNYLNALKMKRNIILDFCEVFVNDPLLETSSRDR